MAKPCSSRVAQTESELTESEMVAAHQLMQLSDEDNKKIKYEDEEVDNQSLIISDTTSAKIQEISGKHEFFRPKKQRRYRSLVDLYMKTRPIYAGNGKKVKPCSTLNGFIAAIYQDQHRIGG